MDVDTEDLHSPGEPLHLVDELAVTIARGDALALEEAERVRPCGADPQAALPGDVFVADAARKKRRAAIYLFEEEVATLLRRCKALHIDVEEPFRDGRISIEQVEPMRYLADEFAMQVLRQVEEDGVELVVIDSTAGFELTLEGDDIRRRLHAFSKMLSRIGVSVILVNEIEALMGEFKVTERGISYLSDNVIFLRYLELDGELKNSRVASRGVTT
jgi:circadian clock protein KaiC